MSRCAAGVCTLLGAFNTSLLENGIVRGAWNMLRVVLETSLTFYFFENISTRLDASPFFRE